MNHLSSGVQNLNSYPYLQQDLDLSDAQGFKVGPDGSRMLLVAYDADVKTEGIPW